MVHGDTVTILALGASGVGKSANGCSFLQKENAFESNSSPDSCTYETSAQSNVINGIKRCYIDTQGLSSSDGLDAKYIKQMVGFLKKWESGVNAIYIIINVQTPRFDQGVQKIIQMINKTFNDPNLWNQTGIIFTRCYQGYFDRKTAEDKYRPMVINFIKTLDGCQRINPQMPCFFVDSVNWKSDESTKMEYVRIFEFAHKFAAVSTSGFQPSRPEYKSKQEEKINRVLVYRNISGYGKDRTLTLTYEDQKRFKYIGWDNSVKYSKPETTKRWNEYIYSTVKQESKVETNENVQEFFRWESYGGRRFGICGPRSKRQVHDYYIITKTFTEYLRDVITDPEGKVSYSDWRYNREWNEQRRA